MSRGGFTGARAVGKVDRRDGHFYYVDSTGRVMEANRKGKGKPAPTPVKPARTSKGKAR